MGGADVQLMMRKPTFHRTTATDLVHVGPHNQTIDVDREVATLLG
jgi:hypothetical protein